MTIIERAYRLAEQHPAAIEGQGGNSTTFSLACALVWGFELEPEEAMPVMLAYNTRCEPPWPQRDLLRMCSSVKMKTHNKPRGYLVKNDADKGDVGTYVPPPKRERAKRNDIEKIKTLLDPTLLKDAAGWRAWLKQRSAVDPREVTPVTYLDALYRPGERVLVFEKMWGTQGDYGRVIGERTVKLARLPNEKHNQVEDLPKGSPEGLTFLMQPVDGRWRPVVRDGGRVEMSRRTKASVTRWPYILLECDKVPIEMWLNVLVRARIRIVSITHSGGRSLHALVRLDKTTEDELQEELQDQGARELLELLGCDHQALNSLVYPRLPNTMREGKRMSKRDKEGKVIRDTRTNRAVMEFVRFRDGAAKQALWYFNPQPEKLRSIAEGLIFEHDRE